MMMIIRSKYHDRFFRAHALHDIKYVFDPNRFSMIYKISEKHARNNRTLWLMDALPDKGEGNQ